jgi:predicted AlkP superfamily pyrophosphatase or phosphodiesterase
MTNLNSGFIKPRYDEGGFAGIPERIKNAFASSNYDAVILLLVDGLGWRFFERFQDTPFLKRMTKHGQVEKLISQFPSTTAAHLTTIHTGWRVGQHGVHEWIYYEPLLDAIIAPLLFTYSGMWERDLLKPTGIQPELLYPRGLLYPELKQMGVESFVFGMREYTPSTYSSAVTKGAELRSFKTVSEALINLKLLLEDKTRPAYVYLYLDKIDTLAHDYGPTAPQTEAEIETFLLMMEYYFERVFHGKKRILFLMTADHGQCEVDPKTTIYLNRDSHFAGIERFFKMSLKGQLLVPAGSPRDMFLYIKDELLEEARSFLAPRLEGKADVVETESLIQHGYFGPEVSSRLRERAGNLVILPYRYESVWWYEKGKHEQRFYGHHGGLTPHEMETILCSYER